MDRRSFFKLMVGGIAAAAAVRTFPFRVFSFPAEIAVPPANTFLPISMITKESLRILENSLKFTRYMSYGEFEAEIPIGSILNIRKPPRFALAS